MGFHNDVHDLWAVESAGRIQDRTGKSFGGTGIGFISDTDRCAGFAWTAT